MKRLLLGLTLLSSCSLNPKYETPAAPVPSQITEAAAPGSNAEVLNDWRKHFTDPKLQVLIEAALKNNRDYRVASLRVEETRALYRIQRADQIPNLAANGTFFRGKQIDPASGFAYTGTQIEANAMLMAFELDFFGRARSLSEAAFAQYMATEEARRTFEISLIASVANTYIRELALKQQEQLALDTLKSREDSVKIDRSRLEAGIANALEIRSSEMLVETSRARLLEVQRQREENRNALRLLVGNVEFNPEVSETKIDTIEFPSLNSGVSSELIARRPDIRQAEQVLIASNANIGAARAAFFPSISLTSSIGSVSDEFSGLFKRDSEVWSFVPQINIPIFMGGRNKANLDAAKIRKEISVIQYEHAIQNAFTEVKNALTAHDLIKMQLKAQKAIRDADAERARLTLKRYDKGVSNYLEYLDSQRSQFDSDQQYLMLQELRLANDIALYRALGGGWNLQ